MRDPRYVREDVENKLWKWTRLVRSLMISRMCRLEVPYADGVLSEKLARLVRRNGREDEVTRAILAEAEHLPLGMRWWCRKGEEEYR